MDLNWIYNLSETLKSESELTHKGHSQIMSEWERTMDFQSFLCQTIGSFIKEKSGTATTKNRWKEYRKHGFGKVCF